MTATSAATHTTEQVMIALLEQGVPVGPISRAFQVDQFLLKELQATLRINKYGSAEVAELLQQLIFDAYEEARRQMISGSPAARTRMISLVLSRSMALVGRQSPEEFDRLRNQLQSMFSDIATHQASAPSLHPSVYSPSDIEPDT